MSDTGWRRGDEAAWWDGALRRWRRGTLTARHTVPTFVYDVAADDGTSVAIPERLLRSLADPGVTLEFRGAAHRGPSGHAATDEARRVAGRPVEALGPRRGADRPACQSLHLGQGT